MEKVRKIEALLDDMDMNEIVPIWNEYCDAVNDPDNRIEDMYEFDDLMHGTEPTRLALLIYYGDFNPNADWFAFDGYGNLVSFDFADDKNSPVSTLDMAEYAMENDTDLGSALIRELLDEEDE